MRITDTGKIGINSLNPTKQTEIHIARMATKHGFATY